MTKKSIADPCVSVIIPVYNASNYLVACLSSVLAQTFQSFEVICINDGSTDRSLEILQDFRKRDARIQILQRKHEGVSSARNAGLAVARGEFIFFLDADDEILPDTLQLLIERMFDSVDAVIGEAAVSYDVHKELEVQDGHYFALHYSGEVEVNDSVIYDFPFTCWGILYRSSIIEREKLRFPPSLLYEDAYWHWAYFWSCRKVFFLNQPVYHYFRRENSIMSCTYEKKLVQASDHLRVIAELYNFSRCKKLCKDSSLMRLLEHYFWLAFQYVPDYEKPFVCTLTARILKTNQIQVENNELFQRILSGRIEKLFGARDYSVEYIRFLRFINLLNKIFPPQSRRRALSIKAMRAGYRMLKKS